MLLSPLRTEVTTMARRSADPRTSADDQPDAAAFWRWVWASVRPVLGYLLVAVGLVLLLTSYLGVSREVLVAKQIPYLVSGGLFGLAFVTLGSRLLLIEDLRRDSGRLDKLERAVAELHAALLSRPDAPQIPTGQYERTASTATVNGRDSAERLLALAGGDSFHRQDCPIVEGKSTARPLTATAAQRKGLHACPMCQPLVAGV
jgi:hypothetical protein